MRTTVDIEPRLLKRLRAEATRRGISFKSLLGQVIRRGLDDQPAPPAPFTCPTFDMGMPTGGINLDKALALAAVLEDDEVVRELELRK
jgi:hypothetical protein